jgi:hypothetical protein
MLMRLNLSPPSRRKVSRSASTPQALIPEEDRAEQAAFAADAYNKVARSAKLRGIMLIRSNFFVLEEFLARQRSEDEKPSLSYGSSIKNVAFDAEKGIVSCEWTWNVTGRTGRKKSLFIQAVYLVFYDELIGCDPKAVDRFLRRVSRFATYPYFRAHVSQTNWESGAKLPIMPTIAT